jgi:chromosome transmission fidelity protein 1
MDRQRALHGQIHDNEKDCGETDAGEPDWVRKHTLERHRKNLLQCEDDLKQRISVARKNLARRKEHIKRQSQSEISKRRRDEAIEEAESDDEFLLESQSQSGDVHALSDDPTSLLSPAVRALMEKTGSRIGASSQRGGKRPFYARHHDKDDVDEEPETTPKIIYASRTHSQISQFVGELKKTKFAREVDVSSAGGQHADAVDTHLTIRSTSLGSRKQMCIHPKVQRTGAHRGIEAMNEKCLDLMKAKGKGDSPRCEFLPSHDEAGQLKMLDYRDASFAEVSDIEDLVALGKTMKTCPYFGARGSARYAHVVTVPYNLLLNKTARATLNINLAASIVIIDEAHNLIDTILSSHSIAVSSKQIERCIAGAESYMARFGSRLKGVNEVNLKKLIKILRGLETFCSEMQDSDVRSSDNGTSSMTTSDLLKRIGGNVDQVNLLELEAWLRETKVAHKIAGYAEKQRSKELQILQATNGFKDLEKGSSASAMISVESLLLSLVDRDLNGRIFLSPAGAGDGDKTCKVPPEVVIKYQLLNPADIFADLAKDARSIILAGGTMEPVNLCQKRMLSRSLHATNKLLPSQFYDFETQLFTDTSRERLLRFSCGHIIPPSNLMAAVVCKGATGKQLEFKFDSRSNPALVRSNWNMAIFQKSPADSCYPARRTHKVLDQFLQRDTLRRSRLRAVLCISRPIGDALEIDKCYHTNRSKKEGEHSVTPTAQVTTHD